MPGVQRSGTSLLARRPFSSRARPQPACAAQLPSVMTHISEIQSASSQPETSDQRPETRNPPSTSIGPSCGTRRISEESPGVAEKLCPSPHQRNNDWQGPRADCSRQSKPLRRPPTPVPHKSAEQFPVQPHGRRDWPARPGGTTPGSDEALNDLRRQAACLFSLLGASPELSCAAPALHSNWSFILPRYHSRVIRRLHERLNRWPETSTHWPALHLVYLRRRQLSGIASCSVRDTRWATGRTLL